MGNSNTNTKSKRNKEKIIKEFKKLSTTKREKSVDKINKEITESLNIDINNSKSYKQNLIRKITNRKRNLTSNLGNLILKDNFKILKTTHQIIQNIYDSNINIEDYDKNINFYDGLFFYNVIEGNSDLAERDKFYEKKIEIINKLFSLVEVVSKVEVMEQIVNAKTTNLNNLNNFNNNLNFLNKEETLVLDLIKNTLVKEEFQEPINIEIIETKDQLNTIKINNNTTNPININKKLNHINKNETKIIHNELKSPIKKSLTNILSKSPTFPKKRNYKKPPLVNIKINLKDFVKQDALERTFMNETPKLKTTNSNIFNISKDKSIINVNDNSFSDIVDTMQETKREYVIAKKKKSQLNNFTNASKLLIDNYSRSKSNSPDTMRIINNNIMKILQK